MADESAKPPKDPGFDAKNFTARLYERVLSDQNKPYAIFDGVDDSGNAINFVRHVQWERQVRNTVNANAIYLDDIAESNQQAHQQIGSLEDRVAALEAQPPSGITFP